MDFRHLSALSTGDRRSYQEKVERFSKTKFGNAFDPSGSCMIVVGLMMFLYGHQLSLEISTRI